MGNALTGRVTSIVRASLEQLLTRVDALLPAVMAAFVVLAVTWGLASLARRSALIAAGYIENPTRQNLVRQVSYYSVWAAGTLVALEVSGVNLPAVVTGLGLGGVALGFALKDILSNLVSGLLILVSHTFEIGDQIIVGETEGTVERIEVRATHIRTYDGRLVLVPNGDVLMSRVTNNTASPLRRASVFVYLDYTEDYHQVSSVILQAMAHVPGVAAVPAPSMRLHDLTPGYLHIEARIWTDSRRTDFMNTASAARVAVLTALLNAGIRLPDPRERHVTMLEPGAPPAAVK